MVCLEVWGAVFLILEALKTSFKFPFGSTLNLYGYCFWLYVDICIGIGVGIVVLLAFALAFALALVLALELVLVASASIWHLAASGLAASGSIWDHL